MAAVLAVPVPVGPAPASTGRQGATGRSSGYVLRAAPRLEPPYDDELGPPQPPQAEQLSFDEPSPWPLERKAPAAAPSARRRHPDPRPWASQFLLAALETMAGRRPPAQLDRWATATAATGVAGGGDRLGLRPAVRTAARTRAPSAALHSVHVSEPAEGVAEVCAVLRCGDRYRALAARLEWLDRRWRCVCFRML
jgi:hypothetical protein